jgi:hypothetical protein
MDEKKLKPHVHEIPDSDEETKADWERMDSAMFDAIKGMVKIAMVINGDKIDVNTPLKMPQMRDDVETDQIAFIRDTALERFKKITSIDLTSSLGKKVVYDIDDIGADDSMRPKEYIEWANQLYEWMALMSMIADGYPERLTTLIFLYYEIVLLQRLLDTRYPEKRRLDSEFPVADRSSKRKRKR